MLSGVSECRTFFASMREKERRSLRQGVVGMRLVGVYIQIWREREQHLFRS